MDFRAFLPLGEALAAGASEAEWRTAISRAYYAAFHVACDWLRTLGFEVPTADRAHGYVILRLSNSGDDEVNGAGAILSELRRQRNRADYEKQRKISSAGADDSVEAAYEMIDALDEAMQDAEIIDAIKKYEREVLKEITWHG
jgi:uncharacterized protein (UPF0332 family)